ncbi:PKD domain-containing protein [Fulvivirgaceae bacterium BMA10]|uniref:PKD domain-containing protein n=1 Tax=Splendidivirga corallicola TaxID=3051826 RepID=A0ABT8KQ97_9BACT|nr:PKD domain-containing protein [Fulvivirgaceae bacterium BMA10]
MTRFYKSLWVIVLAIFALSCKDDEPLPLPIVDFSIDPPVVEVGVPVMFDNLSTNASRYEWDFGDGQDPITDISPSVTFTSAGTVTVTLTAFTEDGQSVEASKEVTVRERVLTGIFVNVFPETNGGEGWDPDTVGVDTAADIVVQLFPENSTDPNDAFVAGIFANIDQGPFGLNVDPAVQRIVLTDEDWLFFLLDFDGEDPATATNDDFITISGVRFNPIQVATFKSDDGTTGFVSVQVVDQSTNDVLDIDLGFRLE